VAATTADIDLRALSRSSRVSEGRPRALERAAREMPAVPARAISVAKLSAARASRARFLSRSRKDGMG
jgi:hypothetical protein